MIAYSICVDLTWNIKESKDDGIMGGGDHKRAHRKLYMKINVYVQVYL